MLHEFSDKVGHGHDPVHPPGVFAGKGETVAEAPPLGVGQGQGDAVGGLVVVAGQDAAVGTGGWGFAAIGRAFQEVVADGPTGHAYRALDDDHVFFDGVDIALLEARVGVAFVGGHEAGSHLDAGRSQSDHAVDVGAVVDAAGGDDGNGLAVRCSVGGNAGDDLGDEFFQDEVGVVDLLGLEAQMAAGHGALHHEGVRGAVKMGQPFLAQNDGGPGRGDDGHELGPGPFGQVAGQFEGQAGAGEDGVHVFPDGCFDQIREIGHGHHDVDAERPGSDGAGGAYFPGKGPVVGLDVIGGKIRLVHADAGGRDDAATTGCGHGGSQPGKRDADTHAALNDGFGDMQVTDV